MFKFIKSLFTQSEDSFTGSEIYFKSKYGFIAQNYEDLLKDKIRSIKNQIERKIEFSKEERLIVLLVPIGYEKLYEDIKEHFLSKGFKSFYATGENIKELGTKKYLFISWDLD